jgi:hypothetical protein
MKKLKKSILLFFVIFVASGCATKEYQKQESIYMIFKTPTFRYADLGFVYKNTEQMKVEMYSNGQAIMALDVKKEDICFSLFECMDKKRFNEKVLSSHYPEDILEHVVRGEAIFGSQNKVKSSNGFTQKLVQDGKYDINYSVLNKQILFRDKINDILIKIKRLK